LDFLTLSILTPKSALLTPNSDSHAQLTNKHIELSHSGAGSTKSTLQTLRGIGKILMRVRTVVFVCSHYCVPARNCFKQHRMTPTFSHSSDVSHLSPHTCPLLVSRVIKVSPELFYVFSMTGKARQIT
jgi:hypothetical protein